MRNTSDSNLMLADYNTHTVRERLLKLMLASDRKRPDRTRAISPRGKRDGPIPLSYAQERLWFLDKLGLVGSAYNAAMALRLNGDLNVGALERTFIELIRRHESLRTHFESIDGSPVQLIDFPEPFALEVRDLSTLPEQDKSQQEQQLSSEEAQHSFDLARGPLFRASLLKLAPQEHVLLITMHHIVSDGWSLGVLNRELSALYGAYVLRQSSPLSDLPVQYADFAIWQRGWLQGQELEKQLSYWKTRLQAFQTLQLPTDRPRPAAATYRGGAVPFTLSSDLTRNLIEFGRAQGATPYMVLLAGFQALLSRYSAQDDIVVGSPIAGRSNRDIEGLIGFFVNTLVLRTDVSGNPTFRQLLERVKEVTLGAYAHQDLPFEKLVMELRPERNLTSQPIVQVMLTLENFPREQLELPSLTSTLAGALQVSAKFDLTLDLVQVPDGLSGVFEYATDLFDHGSIARMARHLRILLEGIVADPDCRIQQLPLLSEAERRQLVLEWNATMAPYPQERCVHDLFAEQVERNPEAPAVMFERIALSYAELNGRANQLARYLRDKGVVPDQLVGICVERSLEMVVGLLGILKAGGAYVPLDPAYPAERLRFMLKDAAPRVLLTQERLKGKLLPMAAEVIALDGDWSEIAEREDGNLDSRSLHLTPRALAYVIYTSGSTGQPKGVMVEHSGVVNLLTSMQRNVGINATDRMLAVTTVSFDIAALEIFLPLVSGAKLVLASRETASDSQQLMEMIEEYDITVLQATPATWRLLLSAGWSGRLNLRALCGGEPLTTELSGKLASRAEAVWNLYGPSETTIWSCGRKIVAVREASGPVESIGRPIANTQVYILDHHLKPVPVGVAGEIHIGGAGVARGYLNRPELTAERFIADPFGVDPLTRLYKTGDLGRWRPDGTLEYLGRNDHQVKIRGFRIELGEIETQLARHAQVKEAVVLAREDVPGEKRLVAYFIPQNPADSEAVSHLKALRAHLQAVLPEYMVPSAFVMLERMPLTPSGKLDRRALPAPELGAYMSREYEAPRGEVEEILARIWQVVLQVERVGRNDNFFELGGHSLLIVQMMERLRRVGLVTELRRVFERPILAELANELNRGSVEQFEVPPNLIPRECEAITPQMFPLVELDPDQIERIVGAVPGGAANIQDIYPLAPLQEGMLFHHILNEQGGDLYVVPTLLSVSSRERLEKLIVALQAVIDRHDVLRTAVLWERLRRPVQVVHRTASLPVEEIMLNRDRDAQEQINEWLKPERQKLDLRQAPLMRLEVTADAHGGQWYALLKLHHIIVDNTSQDIVVSEVVAQLEGRAQRLPASVPYRNHVAQAQAYARTHDAEAFFRSKLGEIYEPTAPFGLMDVRADGSQIEEAYEEIEPALAQQVRMQAQRFGVSAATLFHAAWGLVVAHTSGRDDVVFGTVLLGRLQGSAGAQQILGMFINTLPLRLQLQGATAKTLVERTQRELVDLLTHEQASLAVAQRCSGIFGSDALFTALLNYRHNVPNAEAHWSSASGIQVLVSRNLRTNYPITLSVDDLGELFALTAQTHRPIDPHRMTGYLHTALQSLVDALERAPQTPALALPILPDSEWHQVIELFNAPQSPYPREKLIHELFEERVQLAPDAIAVQFEDQRLTYGELSGRADQLAKYLRGKGVGPDQLVGICVERSLEMVVGLLGILKAGGAYVPLDPNYPIERLAYMLEDSAPRLLLTQGRLRESLPETTAEVIALDSDWNVIAETITSNLDLRASGLLPHHLAYVIYTSGSTGNPKGVMVEHGNVTRLFTRTAQWFNFSEHDVWTLFHSFAFDFSVWELWGALLYGGRVVVVPYATARSPQEFYRLLCDERVTVLNQTPSAFSPLNDAQAQNAEKRHSLRVVIFGGEALELRTLRPWVKRNGADRPRLVNMYGITETTVHVTYRPLTEEDIESERGSPIGKPIQDLQAYLLDGHRQPVPIGVPGEIYVGGAGVARGYLNRPELTAERFLPNPFNRDPQARMYKTGDLGRWRADGAIEYLGRNDNQLKIRGFRVELGEIEAQLARHPQVKEVLVIAREVAPGDKRLVAYVIPREAGDQGAVLCAEVLRAHLKPILPEHMLPSAFVMLETFPLTANGKLDRRTLPTPDLEAYVSHTYEPPQGEVEEILAGIWQELLHVERAGRHDSFFDLGGHSLLALRLLFKVHQSFGATLSVADVYKSATLFELATRIFGEVTTDELVDLSREANLGSEIRAKSGFRCVPERNVLLTGCTGFVGRFLLAQLLHDTDATIHCLVRAQSRQQATSRLRTTLMKWDLWRDEFERRIVVIPGDLTLPQLGIDEVTYKSVADDVDSIYHCATSMNHLETYAMAKPTNVDAARSLLALATDRKPKLINYISTLSVFGSAGADKTRVVNEESRIEDERHPTSGGYAASKWVGEKIFMTASERGIPCNIFRLGLVWADTQRGRYDELQREYRVFKSCVLSGYGIKNYRYEMAPTPVDYVARAVVFLANRHGNGQGIFHISSSSSMSDGFFDRCNDVAGTSLELLTFYEWICQIKRLHYEGNSLPAVPLVEFAFSMDEESFCNHQRRIESGRTRFDLARTHQELEYAGINAPVLSEDLLRVYVESMFSRDEELREWLTGEQSALTKRRNEQRPERPWVRLAPRKNIVTPSTDYVP